MNEIVLNFEIQKDTSINIIVAETPEDKLLYKFILGIDGTWETLRDYSELNNILWIPKKEGTYTIMVQARRAKTTKAFNYVSRVDYIVGLEEEKLIKNIYLEKEKLTVGDKLNLTVVANKMPVVFRYWVKENKNWELIKDYSADNNLIWSVKDSGEQEILVECKALDSKNKFDDKESVKFEVETIKKLEITDFRCLISDLYVGNELVFQVEAVQDDKRMILYKFIKINEEGISICIQDYSTKRMVNFIESKGGEYKLLCLAKDMYSQMEYDDRAILSYKIKAYKDITINSFTSDLSSPQICNTAVTLRAIVSGGKELLYRFKIDGNQSEDSGLIRSNTYIWDTKKPGEYKIEVLVKDVGYNGAFEASSTINFKVEEFCSDPVVINNIFLDKGNKLLKGEVLNIRAIASGGTDLRYSFIEKKDGKEIYSINYGTCNWVDFAQKEKGTYELEVRVKNKYSKREYDSHSIIYIDVFDYIPAVIEQILLPAKEHYVVGDIIASRIIAQNTSKILFKYVLSINGHKVEETDFLKASRYEITPKCSGLYTLEVFAKNEESDKEFDSKKYVKLDISEALPITNTKIQFERTKLMINKAVTFTTCSEGGREVLYQFYLMEKGDWILVQDFSRTSHYTFIPFSIGSYRLLVLCKSRYKKCAYEDYSILEFIVE
jgi:hypothetical protein